LRSRGTIRTCRKPDVVAGVARVARVAGVPGIAPAAATARVALAEVQSAGPAAAADHDPDVLSTAPPGRLATQTIGALEEWLAAIHVARTHGGA
jgi:hypothetical protein